MAWTDKYVPIFFKDGGRDHKGCDCYGLVRLIYLQEFGIVLPDYEYETVRDMPVVTDLVETESRKWEQVEIPEVGNVVVLKIKSRPWHIGIMLSANEMIHIEDGDYAVIERLDSIKWKNRIEGYYRYRE